MRYDDTGALSEASDLLKANWVKEFDTAVNELSAGITGAQDNAQEIMNGISSLQSTALVRKCDLGNLVESKKTFVALVSSLQNWVVLVGLQDSLKGL